MGMHDGKAKILCGAIDFWEDNISLWPQIGILGVLGGNLHIQNVILS